MPRPRTNPPKVKTLEKGLQLLLSLSGVNGEMTLGEITTTVRGHPSTTYRLLAALEKYGFVRRDPHTGRFSLGLRLAELGHLALERIELRVIARPVLQRLMEETAETIHLMMLDDDTGIYIDRVESPQRVRVASSLGERQHLHGSAVGKAMLAFLHEERRNQIISGRLPRFTANTITSGAALRRHLIDVKRRGVAFDDCEVEEGVRCVGAPIFDHTGHAVAAVSVSGPAYRVALQDLRGWAQLVRQGGLEISAALGFRNAGVVLQATGSR